MRARLKELFGVEKPVIAMAHVPALPGTPRYDPAAGVRGLVERLRADVSHLVSAGVNAVMFCNEDDRPYVFEAGLEQVSALTRVVTELAPRTIPFGIDFLWDPMAAMAVAHATGAAFIREVLTGVYESDMGLWMPSAGRVMRFRQQIGAQNVLVFYNVVPEFASSLGTRTVAQRARSAVVSCLADVVLISGPMAGSEPDAAQFDEVRAAIGEVPVFVNTGAKPENIEAFLRVADGVIVGSSLKVDGHTWNPVDPERVWRFMDAVGRARGQAGA
ncbi:MAG: BtpA/SgcQ family protein [Anaerolineales bacterium]|nr:BtpA/SgcQ family protein [Anaerolineales bacterium]